MTECTWRFGTDAEHQQEEQRQQERPTASAVVCVYTMERWHEIQRAVESVESQTVQPGDFIVVVDHNDDLASRLRSHYPRVSVITNEDERGLSGARNTGVRHARGDIVAFLDDDAIAGPTWLEDLVRRYDDPAVYGVGGSATPVWSTGERPRWMPREFDWVVGCSYVGLPVTVSPIRNLLGCSMSFRREVFAMVGGFSSALGRVGKRPLGCEETELCIRLQQKLPAAKLLYDPAVIVRHHVSADRARLRYFLARCYSEGLSKAAVVGLVGAGYGLASERAYAWRVLPKAFAMGLVELAMFRPHGLSRAFAVLLGVVSTALGYIWGRILGKVGPRHRCVRMEATNG